MGSKPGGDDDFAVPRPQRVQNAIDKAERQQGTARFGRVLRHRLQQTAHLLVDLTLPDNAFHHHLRPGLPEPERAANGEQQKDRQRPEMKPAARFLVRRGDH
jgi:hypothetical protein